MHIQACTISHLFVFPSTLNNIFLISLLTSWIVRSTLFHLSQVLFEYKHSFVLRTQSLHYLLATHEAHICPLLPILKHLWWVFWNTGTYERTIWIWKKVVFSSLWGLCRPHHVKCMKSFIERSLNLTPNPLHLMLIALLSTGVRSTLHYFAAMHPSRWRST